MNNAHVRLTVSLLAVVSLTGCTSEKPWGHWEGKGRVFDQQMHDDVRSLTRKATTEFWFTIRPDGSVAGEIELVYDAQLTVALPSVESPLGAFSPSVSGSIADRDPSRRFPLIGVLERDELVLEIAMPEDERPKLDFVIHANAGVTGKMGGLEVGKNKSGAVTHLPMKPFSPFASKGARVSKSYGRFNALYEDKGEHHTIVWSARKVEDLARRAPLPR